MQLMVTCSRPDGTAVPLPILGQRGRALIAAGWRPEARDDGELYCIRLVHPTDGAIGYGAQGQTWAAAWEQLERTITSLGTRRF